MELTIVLNVDDVLILWYKLQDMELLVKKLRERFTSLTVETSDAFMYLGMHLEINHEGNYFIDMCDYILKTCESHMEDNVKKRIFEKRSEVPAGKDLFEVQEDRKILDTNDRKKFHSTTERVLYVTSRFKTTCKVACQVLCTRVTHPTRDDEREIVKILLHLWKTRKKTTRFVEKMATITYAIALKAPSHATWMVSFTRVLLSSMGIR